MSKEHLFSVTKKDLIIQTFRSGGKGGQRQNKVETGVRLIHSDSGAVGESRTEAHQYQNKKLAFRRLVESDKFQKWVKLKAQQVIQERKGGKSIEQIVEEQMKPNNLKIEIKDEKGNWVSAGEYSNG